MAGKSDYLENELLDHVFKTGAYVVPTNIWVALLTSAPTDASNGAAIADIEATYTGYVRLVCNTWDAAAAGATENTNGIQFGKCTAGDSTVTHFALMDGNAGATDNLLYWGALDSEIAISANYVPIIAVGVIDITED